MPSPPQTPDVDEMPQIPRSTSPFDVSGFTYVPRPTDTDGLLHFQPSDAYASLIGEINAIEFDDSQRHLLRTINRLYGLHAAGRACYVIDAQLERHCPDHLLERAAALRILSMDENLTVESDTRIRGLLDMCAFLYFAPLIKHDLDQLPDSPQKGLLQHLHFEICPGGHMKQ
ncbi:uncharacterized protein N7503_006177 [Penicillium pulvis]|uniref:uncharacterized protein n=1 Tax=Penicillium pulvis TaxID=1562058 RepID=UPI002547CC82|nr:uncharacterized protein N7503_006177 [Penicillium pulvis]KAJ5798672.1 hypothetical protein N7503_006177 [Penicillium pulvis]